MKKIAVARDDKSADRLVRDPAKYFEEAWKESRRSAVEHVDREIARRRAKGWRIFISSGKS